MNSGERLSKLLMTPRTNIVERSPALIREPLLGSQALLTEIASYNTTGKTYEDKVTVTLGIAEIVRNTLNGYERGEKRDILTPEIISRNERASCFGQTIVLSECLDQAQIEHFVCFTNGHAFVLLGDREERRFYNIDTTAHKFNGDATQLISGVNIFEQFEAGQEVATVRFNTARLLQSRDLLSDIGRIAVSNDWLNLDGSSTYIARSAPIDAQLLYLEVMPSELGRKTLLHYANAITHINAGSSIAAVDEIKALHVYPDVDPRNSLIVAQNARTIAIEQKHWGSALAVGDVIDAHANALGFLHARYFKAETLRKVGSCTGIGELFEEALAEYACVNPGSRITKGKIQKTRELLNRVLPLPPGA